MRATDMKAHISRITTIETVAVDAAFELCVLYQRTLVERGEVTFIDAHLAPNLVARRNETIAETVVNAVWADIDRERTIGVPAIVILGRNSHAERVARILSKQLMPVINIKINRFFPLAMQTVSMAICNDGIDTHSFLIRHIKAERRNVHGYGDTEVVWIDLRLPSLLLSIANRLCTGSKQ